MRRVNVRAVFVQHLGLEVREPRRLLDAGQPVAQHRRNELGAQLLRVDRERDHARHALARRPFEAQLRLHVVRPAVDGLGERDDRPPRLDQLAQPRQQLGADHLVFAEPLVDAPLGSCLAGLDRTPATCCACGPTSVQTKNDSTNGLSVSASLKIGSMNGRSSGSVLRLRDAQQHADVRPLQVVLDRARQRFRGLAAQLPQHHRRRRLDVVQRLELEIEEHRHRDGDDHGEARREADAAIVNELDDGLGRVLLIVVLSFEFLRQPFVHRSATAVNSGCCVTSAHRIALVSPSSCCRYSRGKSAPSRVAARASAPADRPSPPCTAPAATPAPGSSPGLGPAPRHTPRARPGNVPVKTVYARDCNGQRPSRG